MTLTNMNNVKAKNYGETYKEKPANNLKKDVSILEPYMSENALLKGSHASKSVKKYIIENKMNLEGMGWTW